MSKNLSSADPKSSRKAGRRRSSAIKLGLVCSPGGHFEQMRNMSALYESYPRFWITFAHIQTESALANENRYFLRESHFKRPWTHLRQFPQVFGIYRKERPTHILSTGSGSVVLMPFLLALLFRAKFLHIESFSRVHGLTRMGGLLYKIGFPVYTQWESPAKRRAVYIGPIIKDEEVPGEGRGAGEHVLVTLGTVPRPFTRIIQAVEALKRDGFIKERVVVQAGYTTYASEGLEIFDFCPPPKMDRLIRDAAYVVTQESAGIGTKCLKFHTKFIVMPRDYGRGELKAKSDMGEDLHFKLRDLGFTFIVRDVEELRTAIGSLDRLKEGFRFDNRAAIARLRSVIEGTQAPPPDTAGL